MLKSFKTEIKPTDEQRLKISKTIGVARFVYNLYINSNKDKHVQGLKFTNAIDFSKYLNNEYRILHPEHAWITEVSSKSTKKAIVNAESAFKKFFKKEAGFPKYKKKDDDVKLYVVSEKNSIKAERHRIKVPTIGWVTLKEFGYIPITNDIISSCTISKRANKYFISVLCDIKMINKQKQLTETGIGVDLGLKTFAVTSDNVNYKNINKTVSIKKLEKKLIREQRALSRKPKKDKTKSTTNRVKNICRIQRTHLKLSNKRQEYVRSVVNSLVKFSPKFIAIEDLNVRGMMKNRCLSKAIQKQNFFYFRSFLTQTCRKYGIELRVINRFYPSSKTCRGCGCIHKGLRLKDRVFICPECGNKIDRDYQAALNIRDCLIYKIAQ